MPTQSSRKWWLYLVAVVVMPPALFAVAGDRETRQRPGRTTSFRGLALQHFDVNKNGRLDANEESAAIRALLAKASKDSQHQLLRDKAIEEFDANDNRKLERQEIRTALLSVNAKSRIVGRGSHARLTAPRSVAAIRGSNHVEVNGPQLVQSVQLTIMRLGATDAETATEFAYANFDVNGDGNLDQAELAAARVALQQSAQQLASQLLLGTTAAASTTTGISTPGSQSGGSSGMCGGGSTGSSSQSFTAGRAFSSSSAVPGMIGSNAVGEFSGGFGGGGFGGGFHGGRGR